MTITDRKPIRMATWCAIATTVAIAVGAFVLSFAALRDLAHKAGQPPELTWIWPILLDGSILQATVAVVALANNPNARPARRFFWTVLTTAAAVSIAGNALHATVSTARTLPPTIAAAIATVAPIALLAATHGLTLLIRTPNADTARQQSDSATATVAYTPATHHPRNTTATAAVASATAARQPSPNGATDPTQPVTATSGNHGHRPPENHTPTSTVASSDTTAPPHAIGATTAVTSAPPMPDNGHNALIVHLAGLGWSTRDIGRHIGMHHSTVARAIARNTTATDATPIHHSCDTSATTAVASPTPARHSSPNGATTPRDNNSPQLPVSRYDVIDAELIDD